jgi:hypothetical protein
MRPFRDNDWVAKALGGAVLLSMLPLVLVQIAVATAWEVVDVRVIGLQRLAARLNLESERWWQRLTLRREDAFMVNVLLLNGVLLPAYFVVEGLAARQHGGVVWWRALLYNVLRFGPNVSNFAWVNTLVHKCCHGRLFRHRAMDSVFEFWVGNFFGIMPGNYSLSRTFSRVACHAACVVLRPL